ncbi:haloalkane dehalogenase [Jiangella alba]|uniref:Haloalkane dehalogenase n=1 Tax=Jiangella alba TaxID=561176 RepID=A0A1H5PYQ6_9ACTN|nr:haloalkane dehalogenase [Jiangella alba]SEF18784.1 haloalkane dehalogenase [Jiangella alba]
MTEIDRRRLLAGTAALTAGTLGAASALPATAGRPSPGPRVLRTPDHRFTGLPDYPFEPHHLRLRLGDGSRAKVRMHYVDERPAWPVRASGETILLLHGNPSWSYLYRHVIPPLVAAGHRCVALDLVGMGKSDKPTDRFLYTYQQHMDWLSEAVIERLDLRDVTLVCHDWGGTLGLRLLAEHPGRFRRAVAMNTGLRTGREELPAEGWRGLATWLQFTQRTNPLNVSGIVAGYTTSALDPAVLAAYDAPFPDDRHLHGVRRFAVLIPLTPDDEATPAFEAAWEVLETLDLPFLCVFGQDDHVTGGRHDELSGRIPGATGQPHTVLTGAHHFLQEDKPHEVAAAIDDFIRRTRP